MFDHNMTIQYYLEAVFEDGDSLLLQLVGLGGRGRLIPGARRHYAQHRLYQPWTVYLIRGHQPLLLQQGGEFLKRIGEDLPPARAVLTVTHVLW